MATPLIGWAQLVDDGASMVLDNAATNVTGNIVVGASGSFTFLMLTNSGAVTNTGDTSIGSASTANSNAVVVTGVGSAWSCPGGFYVGDQGATNRLSILDGALVTNQFAMVGNSTSANGNQVTVSGTNSLWNMQWTKTGQYGSLRIGSYGSLNQLVISNGGVVADGFAYIGEKSSATNNSVIVTGPGSLWSSLIAIYIGYNGRGSELLITNGGSVISGPGDIGFGTGGSSRVTVTGKDSLWANLATTLANSGGSNFLLIADGGTVRSSGNSTVGDYTSSNTVVVTGEGSLWTNLSLTVGYGATPNLLVISNGASVWNGSTKIGDNSVAGSRGNAVRIVGAGSLLTNSTDLYVGSAGSSNQLIVLEGGKAADTTGYIGQFGSAGVATIADAGSVWTNVADLYGGYNGSDNQLVVSNAGKVFNRDGYLGYNSSSLSNLVLVTDANSVWSSQYTLYLGYNGGVNQLVVSNAGLATARYVFLGYNSTSTNNSITVAGGSLLVTNLSSGTLEIRRGAVVLNSGLIKANNLTANAGPSAKLVLNGGTFQASTASVNNGSPLAIGDGTNAALYEMSLPAGTHVFANGILVASNAVLTGYGTIGGNLTVENGGTLSLATNNTIVGITVTKGITLDEGARTLMKLNAALGSADHFDGATNVAFGGTLQLTNLQGTLDSGSAFKLFNATHYTGAFTGLSPAAPRPGYRWDTNQLIIDGTLRVFPLVSPPPTITGATQSVGNIVISAAGGIPYDPCYLLTSTNVASPLGEWVSCATNHFDAAGAVTLSQPADPAEPQRFYRLAVE